MSTLRLCLILTLLFSITSCVSFMAATSGAKGMDQHHGDRTWGATIEDHSIETKIRVNLSKSIKQFEKTHISAISFNGIVLLLGQTPSKASKEHATKVANSIRHVRKVHNKLAVEKQTSYARRITDSWMTYKIKTQLIFAEGFPSGQVKVVTEKGEVYLMGLVTEKEAKQATAISRRVKGAKKVVKVFEYID